MTDSCNKNSFPADGTSRDNRLPAGLKTNFVLIDERSKSDIYAFINAFGEYINYTRIDGSSTETWLNAFDASSISEDGNTEPHLALMDAFLDVFSTAQGDLNAFTSKHLEYFYETVLGFTPNAAVPDKANLLIELAKHVDKYSIKKGTTFKAGKQDNNDVLFQLTDEYSFSTAAVSNIKNIFVNSDDRTQIFASEIANSGDGIGGDLTNSDFSWDPFGSASRTAYKAGFAMASPILQMAEGTRTISAKFTFETAYTVNDIETNIPVNKSDFNIQITAEKAWLSLIDFTVTSDSRSVSFSITIAETDPAIVSYDAALHTGVVFNISTPILKILVADAAKDADGEYDLYKALRNAQITTLGLTVDVKGVKNLVVQNQLGKLDVTKPMELFGPLPKHGATFYIGSNEVFKNQLTSLKLNYNYANLPEGTIDTYYTNYINTTNKTTASFKTNISLLNKRVWYTADSDVSLFENHTSEYGFTYDLPLPSSFGYNYETDASDRYSIDSNRGYLKCVFSNGDFGFDEFSRAYAAGVIKGIHETDGSPAPDTFLPNPPFAPQIQDLSLDYSASVIYDFSTEAVTGTTTTSGATETAQKKAKDTGVCFTEDTSSPETLFAIAMTEVAMSAAVYYAEAATNALVFSCNESDTTGLNKYHQFLHTGPFGTAGKITTAFEGSPYIIPPFDNEGELYIGLEKLTTPQNLSLLIQVSEGSANPNLESAIVTWSYLVNNIWVAFEENEILRDRTNGLLTSGIITLVLPKEMGSSNTWLPADYAWIMASVKTNTAAISDIIDIKAQAAEAEFLIYSTTDKNGEEVNIQPTGIALAAGTISKLEKADSSIKKAQQPYASYGAIPEEEGEDFYLRIAERLRHKSRSISAWDYERMVLSKFPSVYKAKCIQHTLYNGTVAGYKSIAPGNTAVIVVPDVTISNAADPLKPGVSKNTLSEIQSWISKYNSPHAKLSVQNPIYEEIEMEFHVKLNSGFDAGIYLEKLQDDVKSFFAPWAYTESTEIQFGGRIEKSVVIYKLENLDYVDYVTCVKMRVHRPDGLESISTDDLEYAEAATAASIFTSYSSHKVENIDDILKATHTEECACTDCSDNIIKDNNVLTNSDCGCS